MAEGNTADRELVFRRALDARPEEVWAAWTEPERIERWWGPGDCAIGVCEMDVRPCGFWRFAVEGPGDLSYLGKAVYLEVERPARLVYSYGLEDSEGEPGPFLVTVEMGDANGGTDLTVRMQFVTSEERDLTVECGAVELGNESLCRLDKYLRAK